MPKIDAVTLAITGSATPGSSDVKVSYGITWDKYDVAADQPYSLTVKLMGDDTNVGDPLLAGPDDALSTIVPVFFPVILRASDGPNPRPMNHVRPLTNAVLNAAQGQ